MCCRFGQIQVVDSARRDAWIARLPGPFSRPRRGRAKARQCPSSTRCSSFSSGDVVLIPTFPGSSRVGILPALLLALLLLAGCSRGPATIAPEDVTFQPATPGPDYVIGPGDNLQIFVWRNPELTTSVPVRPDGRITVPLVEDIQATGKTPTQLARDMENVLKQYVQEPIVNVIVSGFVGPFAQQVRVVGEAATPRAIPYRANLSVLDAMIEVGGLTKFAAGNRAVIIRPASGGEESSIRVRLDDLLRNGDVTANVKLLPGDILIIPQSWF
jgi:polysaccharide biosynthesis/export protein